MVSRKLLFIWAISGFVFFATTGFVVGVTMAANSCALAQSEPQ